MSRVFITGSTDGLGLMAAQLLIESGHDVVLHARNQQRARDAAARIPHARATVIGDLASIARTRDVAEQVNCLGPFDAVIHNASVGPDEPRRIETEDRLPHVFAVNTLAPYILTALIEKPKRLAYLSSGMHRGADPSLQDIAWTNRPWNGEVAYSESKLYVVMLAFAVARRWPGVLSNALEPGWVPTRMGGPSATDDIDQGHRTQAWLSVSNEPAALVSGHYFYHLRPLEPDPAVHDAARLDALMQACRRLSGVGLPDG
jgi:NAD(P)-dependent dehydrogenase (short-subunit alcohol dehydrogenase family)